MLLATAALASPAHPAPPATAERLAEARSALEAGDGIAAEAHLRKALAAGATQVDVAARMGEALLDQGEREKARAWLGPAQFAAAERAQGLRMLGRLEASEGNLLAAASAYDRALKIAPRDAMLWVDVARLRYAGGDQAQAAAVLGTALQLGPTNVRALEFGGQLVRDRYGLAAALPWFEAALKQAPDDVAVWGEYAGTLGELGEAKRMLAATRRMLELQPGNAQAYFLQAALAARAGQFSLARGLFNRVGERLRSVPAAVMLEASLELESDNINLALELAEELYRLQPDNPAAERLLLRALSGIDARQLVARFSAAANLPQASPYMLTAVARGYEVLGERETAGRLLDRASRGASAKFVPLAVSQDGATLAARWNAAQGDVAAGAAYVRFLLGSGNVAAALSVGIRVTQLRPGQQAARVLAGDTRVAAGQLDQALQHYAAAAAVRLDEALLVRIAEVYRASGRPLTGEPTVANYLRQHPLSPVAARLLAGMAGARCDWTAAERLLARSPDALAHDPDLLAALAMAQKEQGKRDSAQATTRLALRIRRGGPSASPTLAAAGTAGPAAPLR